MGDVLSPPSPQEAAQWAVDTTDPENMRRGVALLGTSTFGGVDVYVKLYRFYAEDVKDPLVQAAAISALGRFGESADAVLIARKLVSAEEVRQAKKLHGGEGVDGPFPAQVRLASAIALQRLHNPSVTEAMWRTLLDESAEPEIRIELAIGLGQYPEDGVFDALVTSLDHSELAVNLAALDSLRVITGNDRGLSRIGWLAWHSATPPSEHYLVHTTYLYPTYQRHLGFWDYVVFWDIPKWESPGLPRGIAGTGERKTREAPSPTPATAPAPAPPSGL